MQQDINSANPLAQANLSGDQANTASPQPEQAVSEDGAIGVVKKDLNETNISKWSRTGVSIAELIAAGPLVLTSLLNQADNIAKYGADAKDEGVIGLLASVIETLSLPFRASLNFIGLIHDHSVLDSISLAFKNVTNKSSKYTTDSDDVKINKRSLVFDDLAQRLLHPSIAKEFTSFLFTFRRVIFNFLPNVFTVPSEEHNPDNPEGKVASGITAGFLGTLSKMTSPIRLFTSLIGLGALVPAKFLSSIYAFSGNQKLYQTSKTFADIFEPLNPIIANLSSTFSSAKAYIDSFRKKESTVVTFGKYNITSLNLFQGLLGSVLSVPQFFGALTKIKNKLSELDENSKFKFVNLIRDFVGEIAPQLKALNLFANHTVASMQDISENFFNKLFDDSDNPERTSLTSLLNNFFYGIFNATPFLQNIFGKFRPRDLAGNVLVGFGSNGIESNKNSEKYIGGIFRKTTFFNEIFDLLQPVQSLLMLLPSAFVPVGDPYITDNAISPLRIFDRLLGVNSMILSVPNYLVYALSTRIPQMVLKYFEIKQRTADVRAEKDRVKSSYDAGLEFNDFIERAKRIPILGSSYLSTILDKLEIDSSVVFKDSAAMNKAYQDLEEKAKDQEPSLKASELVTAIRIGTRTLLNNNLFKSERGEDGLTAEEKSRQKIYGSLGTFKEGIARIPVLGWIVGPLIDIFRGMYKVDVKKNRKTLPGIQSSQASSSPQKENNPLAAIAETLKQAGVGK